MANVRNEIATRAAIRFNFVRGVRANRDPCPSYGFVSASRSSACRSSVMNGCTPTFPSNNKLCLLGITLRKWRAPVANPSLESNNRSACPRYARWLARSNFLIEGITRATAYESERGGCLDAQKAEIFTNLYIYIYFWFLNFLFSQRNFVTDWIKVLFRIATLLKRIEFLTEGFSTGSFATRSMERVRNCADGTWRIHGFRIVTSGRSRTWIHLVDKFRSYRWWYIVPLTFDRRLEAS